MAWSDNKFKYTFKYTQRYIIILQCTNQVVKTTKDLKSILQEVQIRKVLNGFH